ncbi:MAG: hypothetical protein JWR77_2256 [Rhizorhabdus sp.]|nr:hypothetical protein [Rhizorhabdus sp.]
MRAGFVGLGNMGGAIAERLLAQGVELHVHDPSLAASDRAAALGATLHGSPRAVADAAETVFGCLPTVAVARHVLLGADGIIEGTMVRRYLEMSTIGPAAAAQHAAAIAERGLAFVDAAVSGGAAAAISGTLAIILAGDADALAAAAPLLGLISDRRFPIGERAGQAQAMKLVNNLLAAANMATSFEALTLGVGMGLDPAAMVEVINAGSGRNTGLVDRRVAAILSRRFDSGPKIALLAKDIELAFDHATAVGFPLAAAPALGGMAELWRRAVAAGMAGDDVSALIRVVEDQAGLCVRGKDSV